MAESTASRDEAFSFPEKSRKMWERIVISVFFAAPMIGPDSDPGGW